MNKHNYTSRGINMNKHYFTLTSASTAFLKGVLTLTNIVLHKWDFIEGGGGSLSSPPWPHKNADLSWNWAAGHIET